MIGYPKYLNTKADYEYVRNNFPKEMWEKDFRALLENTHDWFFIRELETEEVPVLLENQKIEKTEEKDCLFEYKYYENCKLNRLGFTVEEIEEYLK